MDAQTIDKARRRIKRQIATGEHQARVHQISKRHYEYKAVHHVTHLYFRKTFFGGIRQIDKKEAMSA